MPGPAVRRLRGSRAPCGRPGVTRQPARWRPNRSVHNWGASRHQSQWNAATRRRKRHSMPFWPAPRNSMPKASAPGAWIYSARQNRCTIFNDIKALSHSRLREVAATIFGGGLRGCAPSRDLVEPRGYRLRRPLACRARVCTPHRAAGALSLGGADPGPVRPGGNVEPPDRAGIRAQPSTGAAQAAVRFAARAHADAVASAAGPPSRPSLAARRHRIGDQELVGLPSFTTSMS